MNERNADTIRRHFQYEERGDSDSVLADMTDNPRYVIPGLFADEPDARGDIRQVHTGKDAIRRIHDNLFGAFEQLKIDVLSVVADDTNGYAVSECRRSTSAPAWSCRRSFSRGR